LQGSYEAIKALDAEVIAVTTQDLSTADGSIESVGITFPLAYDVTEAVPKQWERFDNFDTELADASLYVIDRDGHLVWQSLGDNYRHQVAAETVLMRLDSIGG
jgi:peroxiredoxin|tara:strand:- start:963 stop:1271 length:309 start_codon:yes stop_codon:yes gene_type:complete